LYPMGAGDVVGVKDAVLSVADIALGEHIADEFGVESAGDDGSKHIFPDRQSTWTMLLTNRKKFFVPQSDSSAQIRR